MSKVNEKGRFGKGIQDGPRMRNNQVEKAKDFKKAIKNLFKYMGKYKGLLSIVVIFAFGSSVFSIFGPKILGNATTKIFEGIISKTRGGVGVDFNSIGRILLIVFFLYVLSSLFAFIQGFIMSGITQKICYKLRKEMLEKINKMPMRYFDYKTHGEVLSRITNDIDTLGVGLNQSVTTLITSVTMIVGIVIIMLTISPLLTLFTVLILPVSVSLIGLIVKKSQGYFAQQQEYLGHVNGQVEEIFSGHNIVQVFNKEEEVVEVFEKTNRVLYGSAWKSQFLSGMMMPIMTFISNLGYVVVAVVGGYLAIKGTIKVGDIQSFIQYVKSFSHPIGQVAQVTNMLQSMAAASERIFELLDEGEEEKIPENPANISISELTGNVRFDNVKFGYNEDNIIINNFSANIKQGQKIAIVGPTGAGKTTIIKLLMRYYDLNSGDILIDGHNIKGFNRDDLRDVFGIVLQDTWLFKGTIMDNIRYGKLDATDEEVIEAAKSANAHHFIMTLPDGYNMELNEETDNVSQGQKQLLTIARAILADKKILILDEATSSVDTRTEGRIQKAMDTLMKGRTSFIIAHRLSTITNADLILVMDKGDIIEQGNHKELLANNGFYSNLYNSQFEHIA